MKNKKVKSLDLDYINKKYEELSKDYKIVKDLEFKFQKDLQINREKKLKIEGAIILLNQLLEELKNE